MKKPNAGMVVSAVAHAAVLAYAIIGFTHAKPFNPAANSMAVEVLTVSEFDKLTKGEKTAKKVDTVEKVEAKKVAAATPEPLPPAPEAKENVDAPPPAPEPEKVEVKEEPKPEPEKKQAEAPPPPPEPKPADLPKPEPKPDDVAKLDDLIKKEIEKKPEPKPEPKKAEKKPEKPKPKFDPTKIATLIDKRDPGRVAQSAPQVSDVTTAGISNGTASQLSLTQQTMIGNMIREQLYTCWNPPAGLAGIRDLMATIDFDLSPDGTLMGAPRLLGGSVNPAFQQFAESAMRAVHSCTQAGRPLRLPAEHYNIWKSVTLDFIMPQT